MQGVSKWYGFSGNFDIITKLFTYSIMSLYELVPLYAMLHRKESTICKHDGTPKGFSSSLRAFTKMVY